MELGADVKVPPQGSHVLSPPVCLFSKESIFDQKCDVCKRQRDIIAKSK